MAAVFPPSILSSGNQTSGSLLAPPVDVVTRRRTYDENNMAPPLNMAPLSADAYQQKLPHAPQNLMQQAILQAHAQNQQYMMVCVV